MNHVSDLLDEVEKFASHHGVLFKLSLLNEFVERAFMKGTEVGFKANLDGTTTDTLIREVHKRGVYMVKFEEPKPEPKEIAVVLEMFGELEGEVQVSPSKVRNLIVSAYNIGKNEQHNKSGMTMQEALLLARDTKIAVKSKEYVDGVYVVFKDGQFRLFNFKENRGVFPVDRDDLTSEWEVYTPPSERDDDRQRELYHADFAIPVSVCKACGFHWTTGDDCPTCAEVETPEPAPKTTGLTFTEAMQAVERGEEVSFSDWDSFIAISSGRTYPLVGFKNSEIGGSYTPSFDHMNRTDWYIIPKEPQVTYVSFEEAIAAVKQGKRARFESFLPVACIKANDGEIFVYHEGDECDEMKSLYYATPESIMQDKWIILD